MELIKLIKLIKLIEAHNPPRAQGRGVRRNDQFDQFRQFVTLRQPPSGKIGDFRSQSVTVSSQP